VIGNHVGWAKLAAGERRPTKLVAAVGRWTLRVLVLPYIFLFMFAGCGATQFSPANRHLLEALQTAVSAKNDQWLEAAAKQVEEQRSKRQMSESEHKALASIIDLAKSGKWDAAQSHIFTLSEGQRPTAEDVARVQKRAPK